MSQSAKNMLSYEYAFKRLSFWLRGQKKIIRIEENKKQQPSPVW